MNGSRRALPAPPSAGGPRNGLPRLLVVGAGGTLGSAVLAEALAAGGFGRVGAVVTGPLASALRGFDPLPVAALQAGLVDGAETAIVVFERARRSNGRDDAFLQPVPDGLPALARRLRAGGVGRMLVVVPHAPALLPQALKRGFASAAEGEVAALGFEHLVFVRAAQEADVAAAAGSLPRFAAWWLAQLKLMVPAQERPLRAPALAALVVALARRLPQARPGTRVLAPETLVRAAQADAGAVLAAWLDGRAGADDRPAAGVAPAPGAGVLPPRLFRRAGRAPRRPAPPRPGAAQTPR